MYQIIYLSKANSNLTQEDIDNILQTAREFNATKQISGCLIYHNHYFLQMLEGNIDDISELYKNITKDPRHSDIKLLFESTKFDRSFGEWKMGFVDLNCQDDIEQKMFVDNLLTFAEITPKFTKSMDIFWDEVKNLLTTK